MSRDFVWVSLKVKVVVMAALSILAAVLTMTSPANLPDCRQSPGTDVRAGCLQHVSSDALERLLPGMEHLRRYEPYELCPGEELDAYAIWQAVDGPPGAAAFLRDQFARIGSVDGLVEWMSCQGFYIQVAPGPFRKDDRSALFVELAFAVYEREGKDLWQNGRAWWWRLSLLPIHAHIMRFFVDESGQPTRIETSDQYH